MNRNEIEELVDDIICDPNFDQKDIENIQADLDADQDVRELFEEMQNCPVINDYVLRSFSDRLERLINRSS
jgi:hypothetical protein